MRLHVRVCVVVFACLTAAACVRSLDGSKVQCTTSDHCPSDRMCSAGKCISRSIGSGGNLDANRVDAALLSDTVSANDVRPTETVPIADAADASTATPALDAATTDSPEITGTGGTVQGTGGTNGSGGIPSVGGRGGSIAGAPGSGGVTASGGIATSGGVTASGGIGTSGGATASGGVVSSGGTVATGGLIGTGGKVGTGGITSTGGATTCQAKPRDCTSALDNDCNGTPDNQESSYCTCSTGQARACQEHPGYDGVGLCKAGSQTCAASTDKTTSSWGACTGSVGPATRNCTSSTDNDCNGTSDNKETAFCQCTPATTQSCLPAGMCTAGSQACAASSDKTTSSWGPCTGYTGPTTQYRDYDSDGYGNPAQPAQVCPGTTGYVSNAEDCDDADPNFKPEVSICGTVTQKKTCVTGGGGTALVATCDQGCINGNCRTDGTIGVPGYVSCTTTYTPRCLAADGCNISDGTCGASSAFVLYCDGPNDCPTGQKCWFYSIRGATQAKCYSSQPDTYYYEVCDPLASTCTCGKTHGDVVYTCD